MSTSGHSILKALPGRLRQVGRNSGFTLLELIASLVLLGLLTSIFGMGLVAAMQSHEFSRSNTQLAQKAQMALTRISRELMELTEIEAVSSKASGQDPFIVYFRLLKDDSQPTARQALHYNTADRTVRLYTHFSGSPPLDSAAIAQGDILVDGVQNFLLSYYQGDTGSPWNPGNDFRLLSIIEIRLDMLRPENPNRTEEFSTMVYLRNTRNFGGAAPTTRPVSRDSYSCFIQTACWQ
jgi:prepilin-type N-terminal cleavage/methylation domain-containing protein